MSPVVELSGGVAWLVVAAPLLLLAAALLLALAWPYSPRPLNDVAATANKRASDAGKLAWPQEDYGHQAAAPETVIERPVEADIQSRSHHAAASSWTEEVVSKEIGPQEERFMPGEGVAPPPVFGADSDKVAVRALIDEAMQLREAAADQAAADKLRNAIILASRIGDRQLHAAARLELGDIAQAEGDLHTACEHWQMARSLYEEEARAADAEACANRMMRNGCPTDWVLTDF
jgi:hypothetical protein